MALAHSILVMAYFMLSRHEPYREKGADYFDRVHPEKTAKHLVKRLQRLGYSVMLQQGSTTAA